MPLGFGEDGYLTKIQSGDNIQCHLNKELVSKEEPVGKRFQVKDSEKTQASGGILNPRTETDCLSQRPSPLKSEINTGLERARHGKMNSSKGHCSFPSGACWKAPEELEETIHQKGPCLGTSLFLFAGTWSLDTLHCGAAQVCLADKAMYRHALYHSHSLEGALCCLPLATAETHTGQRK